MSTLHISMREWETLDPERPGSVLHGFHFAGSRERAQAQELTRTRKLEVEELYAGVRVRTRSHVGRVRVGDLTVTILPKLAPSELLTLLRYAYHLRDGIRTERNEYANTGDLFQDLIVIQLYHEARELLERGLDRRYREQRESLASPRGALDMPRLIARGPHSSAQLPCRYYRRSADNVLNSALAAGLTFASTLTSDLELRIALGRLVQRLESQTSRAPLSGELLDRAKRQLDRMVTPYASALQLIELLYEGALIDLSAPRDQRQLPGFLLDMNRFFQRLLLRFLTENVCAASVESEHGLAELMRYAPLHNPRARKSPRPRPDYCIRQRGRVVCLLDAKYRDLWETKLPREMLYQLTVYALSQGHRGQAGILYPTTVAAALPALIEVRSPDRDELAGHVWLRPVQLSRLAQLITHDRHADERQRWARELAGLV